MRTTGTRTRHLSLGAPIMNEEERALFQRRLALTLSVVFALAAGFWVLQFFTTVFALGGRVGLFLSLPSVQVHLAISFVALSGALLVRRLRLGARALDVADVVSTILLTWGWAAMIVGEHNDVRPLPRAELIPLLATSYTLVTRAALVPSTTARSALIGLASMAPLLPVAYLAHQRGPDGLPAFAPVINVTIWAMVGTACTCTISHVIYGLQLQVRKAMQLGQYLLEDKIGEGGMGVVYRASHAMLRRPTAIKLLTGSAGHAVERFEREVQITARLTHPNTIAVYDYGRTPDGVFYYAMEYLEGVTLQGLVENFGPQPASRVVHILAQVCGALEEAHAVGLVHRDIKPANIMLTDRGGVPDVVKVLDFGLVKESEQPAIDVSNVNTVLGTPHYMAPEAIVDPSNVDGRTDIYALGATAYYLLTGEHVFDGANLVEICSQHLHQAPKAPSTKRAEVPPPLDALVLRCLAKKPEERPADAAALGDLLRRCDVPEWTRADARVFWARPETKQRDSRPRAKKKRSDTHALGDTVAVALDDRGAA